MSRQKASPRQKSLFDTADPVIENAALVTVAPSRAPMTRAQRAFNRLTDKIRRQRAELADWDAYLTRFEHRLRTELEPVEREIREHQRQFVKQLDTLLKARGPGDRLSRRHRRCARAQMLDLIGKLLEVGADPELEALHDEHSDVSLAQIRREEMGMMESALGDIFGADTVQGHDATDVDELLQHAHGYMAEQFAAEERERKERAAKRAERRGRPTKAELAAERKAQAERDASRSMRDIFRKLVSALHPDRETDGMERERKTALMQRVNRAYERRDLLELLTLQIEIEQIDADQLANAPEERLRHFNTVLREQSDALGLEIEERLAPFRFNLDLKLRRLTPAGMDKALTERILAARAFCKEIASALEALADRKRRREVLDALPDPDEELDEFLSLEMLLGMTLEPAPRPKSQRKRKTKKKRAPNQARGKNRRR